MALNRILITGGTGLLALNWACCIRRRFDVILGAHRHTANLQGVRTLAIDLESPDRIVWQLQELSPDLVVHTAGMTSVEQCEAFPLDAEHANVSLAENIAIATNELGIKLIHISTDHLFAGDLPRVSEEHEPKPLNVYARTKLQAENLVREIDTKALIVRTNFFGWGHAHRHSFSDWIIGSLRSDRRITMFDDVFFTPILADTLALVAHELAEKNVSGLFNIVGEERLSKFDFANRVAERFGLSKALIVRGQISQSALSAARPHDMSLDNTKVRGLLGRNLGSLNDFLGELYRQEQQGRAAELRNAVMEK